MADRIPEGSMEEEEAAPEVGGALSEEAAESPPPPRSRRGRHGRRRRAGYRILIATGVVLALAAIAFEANAWLWTNHSNRVGHQLIQQERAKQAAAAASAATLAACATSGPGATTTTTAANAAAGPQGLLEIPRIGLTAPVEQGVDDAALNVAVGHLPNSVWPGDNGNAVVEAHDVSYFVNINQLHAGDLIRYSTPCYTYVFVVQGGQVVQQGSPVYNTTYPSITLITCWPTNALFFTPQRYLVTATHVLTVARTGPNGIGAGAGATKVVVPPEAVPPTVPAPAALAAQGLTLATNSIPMGTLTIAGSPDTSWVEGPGPLAVEGSAIQGFWAGVKSLTQDRADWWGAIAPGVPMPAAMTGAHLGGWRDHLYVTITTVKHTPQTITLTTSVSLAGGRAPGTYHLTVTETVQGSQLLISGWMLS
ncbi:MAG TPA: class D sortase [Acidimicrobiales bacterium]|nr:class D sortase [Acidimicrobiales bacterium]